jgi:putative heme iron utilization protein
MRALLVLTACSAALIACTSLPGTEAVAETAFCASPEQSSAILEYMDDRPGIPLAIPSRNLEIPEAAVSSALPNDAAVGVMATPEISAKVWDSLEAWGADAAVGLVFSPSGQHAFALPSLVPMRVDDDTDGYLDVYADDGAGVHSHIQMKYVSAIYATDVKAPNGERTRGVTYFGPDGHGIIGVFASIKGDVYSDAAVAGFTDTWDLIASMPQACE